MLPDNFLDSYKRYKKGTNDVALWLAVTAREHRIPYSKPRKSSYLLPLAELPKLSRSISSIPEVVVPKSFIDSLKDALTLRKEACRWFQGLSSSDELFRRENQGHLYVVSVLETVLKSLGPHSKSRKTKNAENNADEGAENSFCNGFQASALDDLREEPSHQVFTQASKDEGLPTPSMRETPSEDEEIETKEDELHFALYCFFKDLTDIFVFLRETWHKYKNREIGLMSAAVTIDLGFELVKRRKEEFRNNSGIATLLDEEYMGKILFDFCTKLFTKQKAERDDANETVYKRKARWIAYTVFLPTFLHYRRVCNGTKPIQSDQDLVASFCLDSEHSGVYAGSENQFIDITQRTIVLWTDGTRSSAKKRGRSLELAPNTFVRGIMDYLGPFYGIGPTGRSIPTKSFREMQEVPVWLCFAFQFAIEASATRISEHCQPYQQLLTAGHRAISAMSSLTEEIKSPGVDGSVPSITQTLYNAYSDLEDTKDLVESWIIQQHWGPSCSWRPSPEFNRHDALKALPIWCGLGLFQICKSLQTAGLKYLNDRHITMEFIHLYNALKHEYDICAWEDIEYLAEQYDSTFLFMGDPPQSLAVADNRAALARGTSAKVFAKGFDKHKRVNSGDCTTLLPQEWSSRRRNCRQTVWANYQLTWRYQCYGSRPPQEPNLIDILRAFDRKSTCPSASSSKSIETSTSMQMLASVGEVLEKETEHLFFDYSSMHRRMFMLCQNMAERLRQVMIHESPRSFSKAMLTLDCFSEQYVCMMPMIIMRAHTHSSENPRWLSDHAVGVIKDYVMQVGNLEIKKAREAFTRLPIIAPKAAVDEARAEKEAADKAERERRQRKNKSRNEKRKQKKSIAGLDNTNNSEKNQEGV